jgi:hypothetical protein
MERAEGLFEHLNVRIDYGRISYNDLSISSKDAEILRGLARKVAEFSQRPEQEAKRRLWREHNRLAKTRPPIFCDPENGWNEIITAKDIQCENDIARHWEGTLRKELFWAEKLDDDRVTEGFFDIPHVYSESGWGMKAALNRLGEVRGGTSYSWEGAIKEYEQVEHLRYNRIEINRELTDRVLALATEILGGILNVRLKTVWWWSVGLTTDFVLLRGFNEMLHDFYDNPQGFHKLMAFLRDGTLARLQYLEQNGLLCPNNDSTFVGSGGYGWSDELLAPGADGRLPLKGMWGMSESQITTGISRQMFEEFVLHYQLPLLAKFGLNCYGCCEPLDPLWEAVAKVPRLRRVSVSPWANVGAMAEHLGSKYIFSYKPPPMDLSSSNVDEGRIRKNLEEVIAKTRNCRLEICMKDNHTLGGNPENIIAWCRLAKQASEGA